MKSAIGLRVLRLSAVLVIMPIVLPGTAHRVLLAQVLSAQAQSAFLSGTAQLRKGDFQGAVTAFQDVISLNQNFGPAYVNLGLAYNGLKEYERAIPAFIKALDLDPSLAGADLFLGIDYCKTGAPEKAIKPLEKGLELTPHDADAHRWLGRSLFALERYQEAIPHLEAASRSDPNDVRLQYELAQAHLFLSDQITDRIYRLHPSTYWPHLLKAQAYDIEGKQELALIQYAQVIKMKPDLPGVHEAMAEIYSKKRDFSGAEAEFRKELAINPYDFGAVCALTDVLIETGNTREAVPLLEKASARQPSLGCLRYELGRAWFRDGRYDKAEEHLKAATDLNPTYAPAYILLGRCYAKLGKQEKAQAAFQKSRALDEEHLEHMQRALAPSPDRLSPQ